MQLPDDLVAKIEQELAAVPLAKLKRAREELSRRYKEGISQRMATIEERLSYVATRLPATCSVIQKVFAEIEYHNKSLLDLGSGPGTAYFALPELKSITHLEYDSELIKLGKRLQPLNASTNWLQGDFNKIEFSKHEIGLFSYSFNESVNLDLITKAWEVVDQLVVIEPGTPRGYEHILAIRSHLISLGANVVAPCPHDRPCPLNKPDWCHFAVRVNRYKWHKELKEATLGYEDEKYSYIIVSKTPSNRKFARLIADPEKHSGHMRLKLCTNEGIQMKTLSKKDGPLYKEAKKLTWGDFL